MVARAEGAETMPLATILEALQPIAGAVGAGEWVEFTSPAATEVTDAAREALTALAKVYGVTEFSTSQPLAFSYRAEGEALGARRSIRLDVAILPLAETALAVFDVRPEGEFRDEQIRLLWVGPDVHVKPGGRYVGVIPVARTGATALWWRSEGPNGAAGRVVWQAVEWDRGDESDPIRGLVLGTDAGSSAWSLYAVVSNLSEAAYGGDLAQALAEAMAGETPRGVLVSTQHITPRTVTPGTTIRYTLTLQNVGAAPLTDVAVRLPIPAELSVARETLRVSGGDANWDEEGRFVSWSVATIGIGGLAKMTFEAVVQ